MRYHAQLSAASLVITLATTSPIESRSTWSVQQNSVKPKPLTPLQTVASAYHKYNKEEPLGIKLALLTSNINQGSTVAYPESYDAAYLCPVNIGGQILQLDFDTGSSDLWVFSSELPASVSAGHMIYDPSLSKTAKKLNGQTWNIGYGDGSGASGDVYTDIVRVGATTASPQAVELASQVSSQFQQDRNNDGLLGLAFDVLNTVRPTQQKTFFSTVKGSFQKPIFTADLKKGKPGSYDFGFIDSSKYTGNINYVKVDTSNGFWGFSPGGYAIGSNKYVARTIKAIADTGTTLLYLPDDVVSAYYAKINGSMFSASQGGWTYPCSATIPSITFGIGWGRSVVPGSYITYAQTTATMCFGGIQSDSGIGFSIFGDIFLKSQFVVFNGAATPLIGFASKPT